MTASSAPKPVPARGSTRELLRLAWPLILSNSIWTVQIVLDRTLLSWYSSEAVGASMAGALLFWTGLALFQNTVAYTSVFVAQYTGAEQPHRIGPVIWQALYFSVAAGVFILALMPLAGLLVAMGDHSASLQELETSYLHCLCISALPFLVVGAVGGFFAGRGDSRTVLGINAAGLVVNGLAAYALISGHWGLPALGIVGAGWSTVLGMTTSATVSLVLLFHPRYRKRYATVSGWRFDRDLFLRLMRFGLPNGLFQALDALGFTIFLQLVGRLGAEDLAATSIAFTLNLLVFLPVLGIGQAIEVLVGQRLGEDQPDLAARSTWTGLRVALLLTGVGGLAFVVVPEGLAQIFHNTSDGHWEEIRTRIPVLLRFISVYALFDSTNLVFSFALRGAGDTRFVTRVAVGLSWPLMVLPSWAAWRYGWGLYWAWSFVSLYIIALATTFLLRFRQGRWRTMRVIETHAELAT
jgi:MATE family multidrug resistance protein